MRRSLNRAPQPQPTAPELPPDTATCPLLATSSGLPPYRIAHRSFSGKAPGSHWTASLTVTRWTAGALLVVDFGGRCGLKSVSPTSGPEMTTILEIYLGNQS